MIHISNLFTKIWKKHQLSKMEISRFEAYYKQMIFEDEMLKESGDHHINIFNYK